MVKNLLLIYPGFVKILITFESLKFIKLTLFSFSFFSYSVNSPKTFIILTSYSFILYFFREIAEFITASTVATLDINGLQ